MFPSQVRICYLAWLDQLGRRHITGSFGNFPKDIPDNSVAHSYCRTADEAAVIKMRAVHFPRYEALPEEVKNVIEHLIDWQSAEAPECVEV